ncbi:acetate--CoA ligase family protein [Streptomyces europaeiscabiei]
MRELRTRVARHDGPLTAALSRKLLTLYGLPCAPSAVVPDADGAGQWASAHGYPVVVKVASADVAHRSDVGGVALDVKEEAALRLAVDGIRARVGAARPDALTAGAVRDVEVDEVFVVLAGEATVRFETGESIELAPGVVVRLHAGERTEWEVRSPCARSTSLSAETPSGHRWSWKLRPATGGLHAWQGNPLGHGPTAAGR